jgi:hypothetical protein
MRTARNSISGALTSQLGTSKVPKPSSFTIGKVFAVIMDEKTPDEQTFEKFGGWIALGTIFYLDYPSSKNSKDAKLADCKIAKPFSPNQRYFPLKEELIVLFDLPSPETQENSLKVEKYYLSVINLWNNNHHNAQPTDDKPNLGVTFTEKVNINTILPFEGDSIFEGRNGNSLRFSSTTKYNNLENFWSITGENGDPITLLTNGHDFSYSSLRPYVEDINKDGSAIYLTSTQKVPITVRNFDSNLLFNPIKADNYFKNQSIISSDRVILSAKKDEVLIYGNGIGLSSSKTIYLNSNSEVILDSPKISLGLKNGSPAEEPLLLGNQTIEVLSTLIKELKALSTSLSSVITPPSGTPLIQINVAGNELYTALENITTSTNNLKKLKSTKSYTV